MMYSIYFIHGHIAMRHVIKDYLDNDRGNLLPLHGLLLLISSKGSFICIIPQTGQYISYSVTPVVEHWMEMAQWVHHDGMI